MWFTTDERNVLCHQALERWQRSERLRARSAEARQRAELLCRRAGSTIRRSEAVVDRAGAVIGEAETLIQGSGHAAAIEHLADRAISRWRGTPDRVATLEGGYALVASGEAGDLTRMQQSVGMSVGSVFGASDAGTALGLAIAIQPDLAVIDAKMELADGVDMALALPLYAPRTRALVLTDDRLRAAQVRVVGFDTEARHISDAALGAWIAYAAA